LAEEFAQNSGVSLVSNDEVWTPYYLTVNGGNLYLAIFNQGSPGSGDSILQFAPLKPQSSPVKNNQPNKAIEATK
jgi:hypothetical protein